MIRVLAPWILRITCAIAAFGCGAGRLTSQDFDGPQILLIGNSLTYTNDLPGMIAAMIDSAGAEPTRFETLAFGGFGLQDHWVTGARDAIAQKPWRIVVLQQGPSATEGRPSLLEYSKLFDEEVRRIGGRTALYMVWPSLERAFDFDGVSDSYRTAAEEVDGMLFPVGEAWRAAWRRDSTLQLYGPDQFHPSVLGTYLGALVFFQQLTGLDPAAAPLHLVTPSGTVEVEVAPDVGTVLQEAAAEANQTFARP